MYASGNIGPGSSHDHAALQKNYFVKCVVREKGKINYLGMCRYVHL